MAKKRTNNWGNDVMGELQDSQFFSKQKEVEVPEKAPETPVETPKPVVEEVVPSTPVAPVKPAPQKKSTETIARAMYITDEQDKKLSRIEKKIASRMKSRPVGKSLGKSAIVRYLIDTIEESEELYAQLEQSIIEEVIAKMRG